MHATFTFNYEQFNRLFPYFMLIDKHLKVISCGASLKKLMKIPAENFLFHDVYKLDRPFIALNEINDFEALIDQVVIISHVQDSSYRFRGQFEWFGNKEAILFIGSPWFDSIDTLSQSGLTMSDFAVHDSAFDLLNVLKTKEIVNDDIKQLLTTINKQKKDLKRLSMIAEETKNPIIITNPQGEIEWVNKAFERFLDYKLADIKGKKPGSFLQGKDTNRETAQYMRDCVAAGEAFDCEILNYKRSGESYWLRISGQPIKDKKGNVIQYFAIQEDITTRKVYDATILGQRAFYENILNCIPSDIAVFDKEHRYVFINPVGIRDEEIRKWIIGKTDFDYCLYRNRPSELAENRQQIFKELMTTKRGKRWEDRIVNANGDIEYYLRNMYPVIDENSEVDFIIGYGMNITHLKRVEHELYIAKEEAERAARAEKNFLANMSHEIRTPLNAIIGMANLLYDTSPSPKQVEYIELLNYSSKILLGLINDILDFNKITSGSIEPHISVSDLREILQALYKTFKYRIQNQGIDLVLNIDEKIPKYLELDEQLMNQILLNILGNATKFTKKGKVSISISVKKETAKDVTLIYAVKDTGIGIAKANLSELFKKFKQVSGQNRTYGGTGLGLAITKELVTLLGGTIKVKSKLGVGSEFIVTLKHKKASSDYVKQKEIISNLNPQNLAEVSILIAEDNEMNIKYLSEVLAKWNVKKKFVYNGLEATKAAEQEKYDLIFMDIQMPIMDGIEASSIIRTKGLNKETPILALTASTIIDEKGKALTSAGINDYILKPFLPNQILQVILNHVKIIQIDTTPETEILFVFSEDLNNKYLNDLYEGDIEHALDMFETYIVLLEKNINQLTLLCQNKDYKELSATFHKIKPSFGLVGLSTLEEKSKEMELVLLQPVTDHQYIQDEVNAFIAQALNSKPLILQEIVRMEAFINA